MNAVGRLRDAKRLGARATLKDGPSTSIENAAGNVAGPAKKLPAKDAVHKAIKEGGSVDTRRRRLWLAPICAPNVWHRMNVLNRGFGSVRMIPVDSPLAPLEDQGRTGVVDLSARRTPSDRRFNFPPRRELDVS